MEKARIILTKVLMAFALVSVGFSLGRHSVVNSTAGKDAVSMDGRHVAVYYMHSSFRCATCNAIEKMTKGLLDKSYAKELADGRVRWQEVDFQENEALAKRFDVMASCVVVALVDSGEVVAFKRLDEVWTLMSDPAAFENYISGAIDPYLEREEVRK